MPRTAYTEEKVDALLALVVTYGGRVSQAARMCGITRTTVYNWAQRYPEFAERLEDAKLHAADLMEAEAHRRAFSGYDEELHHRGLKTGDTVKKYSDTLAIFLLKANNPDKFRERVDHNVTVHHDQELVERLARGRGHALPAPDIIEGETVDEPADLSWLD